MKKTFCTILFSFIFFTVAETATIKIENFTASSQSSITVPVIINCQENFAGFQFSVRYSSNILKCTGVSIGSLVSTFNMIPNIKTSGIVRIAGFDADINKGGISGQGILANMHFQIVGAGISSLSLQSVKLSDSEGKSIPCNSISGKIQIEGEQEETEQEETESSEIESQPVSSNSQLISETTNSETFLEPEEETEDENDVVETIQPPVVSTPEKPVRRKLSPLTKEDKKEFQPESDNCVLLIKSEYGSPIPSQGITTYEKGEKIECKVEKEVILNKKEKAVCIGYEGEGSVSKGSSNKVSFIINQHSKIIWKWEKDLIKKDLTKVMEGLK